MSHKTYHQGKRAADRKKAVKVVTVGEHDYSVHLDRGHLANAIEAAGIVTFSFNLNTDHVFVSAGARTLLGFGPSDRVKLETLIPLVEPADLAVVKEKIRVALASSLDSQFSADVRVRRRSGEGGWLSIRGRVERSSGLKSPSATHIVGACWDITALKTAEQGLRDAIQRADASNAAKGEFLASVSHEIRTPMTSIIGYADLLSEGTRSPAQRIEFVETIRRNGEHMLCLINDLLDLSKIEAGKMTIERVRCSPAKVVCDVESAMRSRAAEKGIRFDVQIGPNTPTFIRSDPTRLRQVLLNLVTNAVKFTDTGGVRVVVDYKPDSRSLQFAVHDTGIGLTEEQQAHLFVPFEQADNSTARRFGGTGLGLVLSRDFVALLGGELRVQSKSGTGSVFSFALENCEVINPEEAVNDDSHVATFSETSLKGKVLVAEDGADNRRLIVMYLEGTGLEVETAADGQEAVKQVERAAEKGEPFDLVLMDMQMPVMDGYAATRELRNRMGPGLPIIAFTAHAMDNERERCLAAGCNGFASKPIEPDSFIQCIAQEIKRKEKNMQQSTTETSLKMPVVGEVKSSAPLDGGRQGGGPVRSSFASHPKISRILPQFIAGLPGFSAEMTDALVRGDWPTLRRLAHQLRGTGSSYGFPEITRLGERVELCIDGEEDSGAISASANELIDVLRNIEGYERRQRTLRSVIECMVDDRAPTIERRARFDGSIKELVMNTQLVVFDFKGRHFAVERLLVKRTLNAWEAVISGNNRAIGFDGRIIELQVMAESPEQGEFIILVDGAGEVGLAVDRIDAIVERPFGYLKKKWREQDGKRFGYLMLGDGLVVLTNLRQFQRTQSGIQATVTVATLPRRRTLAGAAE